MTLAEAVEVCVDALVDHGALSAVEAGPARVERRDNGEAGVWLMLVGERSACTPLDGREAGVLAAALYEDAMAPVASEFDDLKRRMAGGVL